MRRACFAPSDESKAVIDDAAAQLGVQPKELSDALKQALKNRIDEAVDAGKLTKEQANELKKRIDSERVSAALRTWPASGRPGDHGRGAGFGFSHHFGFDLTETAAAYLGMTETELREALHDQTLAEIAKEKGKSVSGLVQAFVATQEKRIDEAVADGHLTKAQATELKAKLEERTQALVNGDLRGPGDGFHHRFWPGSASPRAPPAFGGPRA